MPRRHFVVFLAGVPLAAGLAACIGGDADPEVMVFADGSPVGDAPDAGAPAPSATVEAVPFSPTAPPSDLDADDLTGFAIPIEEACLPSRDEVMPNAPRAYRNGVHEGVDFYHGDVCTDISLGTPVRAMYRGVVVRADHDYEELTLEDVERLDAKTAEQGDSDPETLDVYRGRQVWVDHGNGIVTRYAHLSGVADGVAPGLDVYAGDVIGAVGESGTPESVTAPGTELHLHAEVRIEDGFLGKDLPPEEVRGLYQRLFEPVA
ncbi:MAG: peptidoglycan DD-metalloendopeptidase family protein [Dehalococcoidia bacterium]|nr:peptidoglycan DD-metalloendopeptidase family protein [Dehalococcoidia bacterium]